VPQVEAFPILKVRKMPVVDESLLPADADARHNAPGRFQFYTGDAEYVMKSNTLFKSIDHYPGPELPQVLAEDCSFSPAECAGVGPHAASPPVQHGRQTFPPG